MWLKVIIAIALGVAVSGTPLHNDGPFLIESFNGVSKLIANPPTTYRLPNDSYPLSYDLYLRTDIDQGIADFQGRVKIHIKMQSTTNEIVLHSKQINITNIDMRDPETLAAERNTLTFYYIQSHDFLVIDLGVVKNAGIELVLDIQYIGKLRDDQEGFYRGSYKNENNEDVWYATTQFEIAEARSALPCYDEPGIRANIKLAISHKPAYEAHANMPILTKMSDDNPAYNKTIFMETPPMQTYLLAFLVSDFKFRDAPSASTRIPQKIYAISEAITKGYADYAASVVGAVVKNLDEYIGFNYPLPKLDHVALNVFKHGAMENFGLITYIDNGLLMDPNTPESSRVARENGIAGLIAHETAHQWFGDIVSPQWWSYTWLNEGFATLFSNYIIHLIYPERNLLNNFVRSNMPAAFSTDEQLSTWSMNHYTEIPAELWTKFNNIGYSKSGCVLRMFQESMTVTTFAKALKYYMQANQMKAATPDNLHKELQRAYDEDFPGNGVDIGAMMSMWENNAGYPMVSVSRNGNNLEFSQTRYPFMSGEIYAVPLTFATKTNKNFNRKIPKAWLSTSSMIMPINDVNFTVGDWIVLNLQQVGYYRVDYSTELWHAIINQLITDYREIDSINRAVLQDEIYIGWSKFSRITASDVLNSLLYFSVENEVISWSKAGKLMNELKMRLAGSEIYDDFENFVKDLTNPHLLKLGFEGIPTEHSDTTSLRNSVRNWNCLALNGDCLLREYQKHQTYLDTGVISASFDFCHALVLLDENSFDQILTEVTTNTNYNYRNNYLSNLGCNRGETNLRNLLNATIASNNLSNAERISLLQSIYSRSQLGLDLTLDFLEINYRAIDNINRNLFIDSFIKMTSYVNSGTTLTKYGNLRTALNRDFILSSAQVLQTTNVLKETENWHTQNYEVIKEWFESYSGVVTEPPTTTPNPTPTSPIITTTPPIITTTPRSIETTTLAASSFFVSFYSLILCLILSLFFTKM